MKSEYKEVGLNLLGFGIIATITMLGFPYINPYILQIRDPPIYIINGWGFVTIFILGDVASTVGRIMSERFR